MPAPCAGSKPIWRKSPRVLWRLRPSIVCSRLRCAPATPGTRAASRSATSRATPRVPTPTRRGAWWVRRQRPVRSLFAQLVMVLFCLLLSRPLVAQDELRIVLIDGGSPELARKVEAEGIQVGFTVATNGQGAGEALAHV